MSSALATSASRDRDEERALFERWQRGREPAARAALVERYLPLARRLARRYAQGDEPLDDLVQVASLGLVKAVDRFDTARPVVFSSFAVPTILGELKRHFRDRTWSVRVPRDLQELALRADRTAEDLARHLGRRPTVPELAEAAGACEEQILEALEAAGAYRAASLEAPRRGGEGDDDTVGSALGHDEGGFALAEHRAVLERLLATLDGRERMVLRLRFEQDLTQSEIGEAIGVSQMQVSRILRRCLGRMSAAAATARDPGGVGPGATG
ncbi:MAG: SigB/SigF/SigG family RNA polymerase sigma factor [Solirubrobacteraceae bacterium MAG38_C4-C5]|nr:SigB/SigF/SigG family RNA polymerase sigma factor [Candidatus Siliceabacter maunaloa]